MTPKNRRTSLIDDPFSVEATLSVSLQKRCFFKLSIWPLSSNIKLEGLSFLYSHSFMKKRSWLFDYFYAIWVNFTRFFENMWNELNVLQFDEFSYFNVKKYQHQLSQKKMYPCTVSIWDSSLRSPNETGRLALLPTKAHTSFNQDVVKSMRQIWLGTFNYDHIYIPLF